MFHSINGKISIFLLNMRSADSTYQFLNFKNFWKIFVSEEFCKSEEFCRHYFTMSTLFYDYFIELFYDETCAYLNKNIAPLKIFHRL